MPSGSQKLYVDLDATAVSIRADSVAVAVPAAACHLYEFEIYLGVSLQVVLSLPSFDFPGAGHGTSSALKWVDEEAEMLAATHTTKSRVEMLKLRFVLNLRLSRCFSLAQPGP